MKLALLLIFLSINAFSFVDNVDNQRILPDNLTVNGGAEQGTKLWTESGGGTLTTDTSNKVDGNKAIKFTYSDAGDYLKSESVTPKTDGVCEALFLYKTASTAIDWAVYDGSGNQISDTMSNIAASSSKFSKTKVLFTCSTASTYHIRITGGANTEILYVDNLYIGKTRNIGLSAQAIFVGSIKYAKTASCMWGTTSTGYANLAADTDCATPTVTGNVSAPATKIPAIVLPKMPEGTYFVTVNAGFTPNSTNPDATIYARVSDGTYTYDEQAIITTASSNYLNIAHNISQTIYNSAGRSSVTIQPQLKTTNASNNAYIDGTNIDFSISVYYFPSSNQQVQTADTSAQSWSGHFGTSCSHAVSSSTYTAITDATSCNLVEDSNKNFGTVTKYGDVLGFTFTPKQAPAKYLVCAWSSAYTSNSSVVNNRITSNGTSAIAENNFMVGSTYVYSGMNGCGILDVASITPTNIWIETKSSSGTTTIDNNQGPEAVVKYSIVNISQPLPQPTYNSIITKRAGVDRIVRGSIAGNGTILSSGSGDWTSANPATGRYNITFSPAFPSTDYQCNCTSRDRSRYCTSADSENARTSSGIQLTILTTSTQYLTNDALDFTCIGAN